MYVLLRYTHNNTPLSIDRKYKKEEKKKNKQTKRTNERKLENV